MTVPQVHTTPSLKVSLKNMYRTGFSCTVRILPYCLVNIHPQAGKDDVRGEGCNAGGAHDNLRKVGGLEERGLYTVPLFVKLPLPSLNVYGRGRNIQRCT